MADKPHFVHRGAGKRPWNVTMREKFGPPWESAKLTDDMVREIRQRYAKNDISQAELAKQYGVSRSAIKHVVNRTRWGHVA